MQLAGVALGLAECGNRADAGLLRPPLADPAAGVRARAVAGLREPGCVDTSSCGGFLTPPAPVSSARPPPTCYEQLRRLLDAPGAGVVRETATALLRPGDAEAGELLDRSRRLFSDHMLRRRKWDAGLADWDCIAGRNPARHPPSTPLVTARPLGDDRRAAAHGLTRGRQPGYGSRCVRLGVIRLPDHTQMTATRRGAVPTGRTPGAPHP
ncbi:hypothetical protein GCM10023329_09150 [Streptomyces sanyensis]|uniref:Uncharacterized protein n=1 Tax=Streptomyces sanyensis TaxID=568869 RepID=A0ABP8ZTA7_9ACTN